MNMSGKSDKTQADCSTAPSAPEDFQHGPPPPSYDECLKINGTTVAAQYQYTYYNPSPYQQQQSFYSPPSYMAAPPQAPCGYSNPYQMHIQQQQNFYNASPVLPQLGTTNAAENVLYLAKGAKVRTTASGAISIPPPPPGCAPTPGQMAAMTGQPVIIKKQKKSFF